MALWLIRAGKYGEATKGYAFDAKADLAPRATCRAAHPADSRAARAA